MALTAASLLIDVDADTSRADRALSAIPGKLQNIAGAAGGASSSLSDMFAVSGGVMMAQTIQNVTQSIWGLGQTALQSYAFSERLGASMQAMLSREMVHAGVAGSVEELRAMPEAMAQVQGRAKELQQWMEKFAIQSPFTYEDVSTAFRLAQTYGFTSTQATRLTEATANFASGSGQTGEAIRRVSMALGQMRTTGKVLTQDLRQMTNVGVDVYGALSRAFDKPTEEIMVMIKKGLIPANDAIEAIVSSLEQDFGAAAKEQAGTVTGLMASMSDIVPMRARDLFAGIIRTVQPYLDQLVTGLVDENNIDRIKQIGESLGVYVGGALNIITTALSRFTVAFGDAGSAVGGIVSGFSAMLLVPEWVAALGLFTVAFSALTPVIAGFGTLATSALTAVGVILGTLSTPITLIAASLVLLYAAWDTNFGGIRDLTDGTIAVIQRFYAVATGTKVDMTGIVRTLRSVFGAEMARDILKTTDAMGVVAGSILDYINVIRSAGVHTEASAEAMSYLPDNLRHYATLFEYYADGVQNAITLVSDVFTQGRAPEAAYFEVMEVFGAEAARKLLDFSITARQVFTSVTQTIENASQQIQQVAGAIWLAFTNPEQAASALNLYERLGIEPTMATEALATVVSFRTQLLSAFNQIAAVLAPAIGRLGAAWNNMLIIFRAPVFARSLFLLRDAFFSIGGAFGNLLQSLSPLVQGIVALGVVLADFGLNVASGALARLPFVFEIMVRTLTVSLNTIAALINSTGDIIRAVFTGDWETVASELQGIWDTLVTYAEDVFLAFSDLLTLIWDGMWLAMRQTAADFGLDLDAIVTGVEDTLGGFGATLSGFVATITSALQPAIAVLAPMFDRLSTTFSTLPARLQVLAPLMAQLGDALGELGVSLLPTLQAIGMALGALITLIIDFVGNIGAALGSNLPAMVAIVISQMTLMVNAITTIFNQITQVIQGVFSGDWGAVFGGLGEIFNTIGATFAASLQNIGMMLGTLIATFGQAIMGVLSDLGVTAWFQNTFGGIGAAFNQFFSPIFNLLGQLVPAFSAATSGADDMWQQMLSAILGPVKVIIDGVISLIKVFTTDIPAAWTFMQGAWTTVQASLGAAWAWLSAQASVLGVNLTTALVGAWDSIRGALGTMGAFFSTTLPAAFLLLQTRWNALWTRVRTVFAPVVAVLQPAIVRLQSTIAALAGRFAALSPRFAALRATLDPIIATFGGFGAALNAGGETLQRFVDEWVIRIKQWVAETIRGSLSLLGELGTLPGRIGQFLQDMATRIQTFDWGGAWANIVTGAQNIGGQLQTAVANWLPLLQAGWSTIVASVQNFDWGATWATIVTGVQNAGISIQNAITGWQPYVTAGWNTVKSTLIAAGNTLGVDLAPSFATVETGWATMWTNLQATASTAWINVSANLQAMWQWLQVNLPVAFATVWVAGSAAWNGIGTTIDAVWQGIQTVLTNMQTFFTITLPAAFTTLQTKWGELWTALDVAFQPVRDVLEPAFTRLQTAFTEMGAKFSGLTPNVTGLQNALQPVSDLFAAIQEKMAGATQTSIDFSGAIKAAQDVTAAFVTIATGMFTGMIAVWTVVATVGINTLTAIFGGLPIMIGGIIDQVTNTIKTITGVFGEVVAGVQAIISGDWQGAWNSFKNAGRIAIDGLNNWIIIGAMGVGTTVLGIRDIIVNSLRDLGIDTTPLANAIQGVKDALTGLTDWIGGLSFPNPFAAVTGWADEAIRKINSVLMMIPGGIQIPIGATGGTGDSGVPFKAKGDKNFKGGMAIVGEEGPELVILPSGANIVPNGLTEQVAALLGIPGFAEGTLPTGTQPRLPPTVPVPSGQSFGSYGQMVSIMHGAPDPSNVTINADGTVQIGGAGGDMYAEQSSSYLQEGGDALVDAGKATENAFKKAAEKAQGMLQQALQGVEGLFGKSSVTQDQMDMAALGIPQNFADDYLRQLTDEVLNGVDWAGVDIQDAAKRAGIDPTLPIDAILKLFTNAWQDSSLFANPENLGLINQQAVQAQLQAQQQAALGKQNLMQLFGISPDEATVQANAAYATLLEGMSANFPVDLVTAQGATMRLTFMTGFNTPAEGEGETMKAGILGMFPEVTAEDIQPVTDKIMGGLVGGLGTSLTNVSFTDNLAGAMIGTVTTTTAVSTLEGIGGRIWSTIWNGVITGSRGSNVADIIPTPPLDGTTTNATNPDGTPIEPPTPLAVGTRFHPGGLSLVGELGPELVAFPRGARVWSNKETMAMLDKANAKPASSEPSIVIQAVHVHNDMDVEALGYRLQQLTRRRGGR